MTLVPPVVTPVAVDPISIAFRANQDLQPFSYRSTMTYSELLNSMRNWLYNTLVPYLNTNFEDVTDSWSTNVAQIDAAINTALSAQADTINTALATQQQQVADELASTLAQIASGQNTALYDSQILAGLQSAGSTSLAYLDGRYTVNDKRVHDALNTTNGTSKALLDGWYMVNDTRVHDVLSATTSSSRSYLNGIYADQSIENRINGWRLFYPEDYVQSGDNGDWALTIRRALDAANGNPVQLSQMYRVATPLTLKSNDHIVGLGAGTGLLGTYNAPMSMISGNTISGVWLSRFTIDANCESLSTNVSARAFQFTGCTDIHLDGMIVLHTSDWGTSFVSCNQVFVRNHSHKAGVTQGGMAGGRDGVHFLDCNDFLLDGAVIHSGDDCVGITTQNSAVARGTIRNVKGISEIAAIVTVGVETGATHQIADIDIENISSYTTPNFAGNTQYGVKVRAQNTGVVVKRIRIANVAVISVSYGLWLDGTSATTSSMDDVTLTNIRAESSAYHGIYLNYVSHLDMHGVFGKSQTGGFDGIHFQNCNFVEMHGGGALGSALWGIQLNACTYFEVWGANCRDNGGANFSASNGGNMRIVNSSNGKILGGQYVGGTTTSYYGINQSGNTSIDTTTIAPYVGSAH